MRFQYLGNLMTVVAFDQALANMGVPVASPPPGLPVNKSFLLGKAGDLLKKLRSILVIYHTLPLGKTAGLNNRVAQLKVVVDICDELAALFRIMPEFKAFALPKKPAPKKPAPKGPLSPQEKQQAEFKKLPALVLSMMKVANRLVDFLLYAKESTDPKKLLLTVLSMQPGLTPNGLKLQSVTSGHYGEVLEAGHFAYNSPYFETQYPLYIKHTRNKRIENVKSGKDPNEGVEPFLLWLECSGEKSSFNKLDPGDDDGGKIGVGVNYMDKKERKGVAMEFRGGKACRWKNDEQGLRLELYTTYDAESKQFVKSAFSIDQDGVFYVFDHQMGEAHHSTATAGGAVICAGCILIDTYGCIDRLDDFTGHYASTPFMMLSALRILDRHFALTSKTIIEFSSFDGAGWDFTAPAHAMLQASLAMFPASFRFKCASMGKEDKGSPISAEKYALFVAAAKDVAWNSGYYKKQYELGKLVLENAENLIYTKGLTRKRGKAVVGNPPPGLGKVPARPHGKAVFYKP
jgi:hypothetical protein